MKKILNLLAGVTLVASSAAPVVACGNKSNNSDQDKVNSIVKDITTKNLTLPYGQGDYSFANDKTKLVNDLIKANPKLTADDAKYITIAPAPGASANINMEGSGQAAIITVKVGSATKTVTGVKFKVDNTWTKEAKGIPAGAQFHVSPVNFGTNTAPQYYLGSAKNGLWHLDGTNSKATWTQVQGGLPTTADSANIHSVPVKIGDIYFQAFNGQGLWYSTNLTSWTQATAASGETGFATAPLVTPPVKFGNEYYQGSNGAGLWKSSNGKNGWTQVTGTAGSVIPPTAKLDAPLVNLGTSANPLYYQATDGQGLWYSNDLTTTTWTKVTTNAGNLDDMVSAPVRIGDYYYQSTTDAGVFRAAAATAIGPNAWQRITGANATDFYSQPVLLGNTIFAAARKNTSNIGGLYTILNNGSFKKVTAIPTTADLASAPVKLGDIYYQTSMGAGVWTSTDGINWKQNTTPGLKNAYIDNSPVLLQGSYVVGSYDGDQSATPQADYGLWRIHPEKN